MTREIGKCAKCGDEEVPLNEVDKDDFDVLRFDGEGFSKPPDAVVVRKICDKCCRG